MEMHIEFARAATPVLSGSLVKGVEVGSHLFLLNVNDFAIDDDGIANSNKTRRREWYKNKKQRPQNGVAFFKYRCQLSHVSEDEVRCNLLPSVIPFTHVCHPLPEKPRYQQEY